MHLAWQKGDLKTAAKINARLAPLNEALFLETSPAPVKYGASLIDQSGLELRLPLVPVTPETQTKVKSAMRFAGLLN
jgi:4-hydroxy-tetrahydrodipicolinate synthase